MVLQCKIKLSYFCKKREHFCFNKSERSKAENGKKLIWSSFFTRSKTREEVEIVDVLQENFDFQQSLESEGLLKIRRYEYLFFDDSSFNQYLQFDNTNRHELARYSFQTTLKSYMTLRW